MFVTYELFRVELWVGREWRGVVLALYLLRFLLQFGNSPLLTASSGLLALPGLSVLIIGVVEDAV